MQVDGRLRDSLVAFAIIGVSAFQPTAQAQTRCEPTLSNPCKPPAEARPSTLNEALKPREGTRLTPQPLFPDIKVDKDTSMGFGHNGGIIGLERKF